MVSTLTESAVEEEAIPVSKKVVHVRKPDQKCLRTFVFVDENEAALNRSSCSSLTDDSDLTWEIDPAENVVLFRDDDYAVVNPVVHQRQSKRNKPKSVSYAQLFFDPETQMLVTLMEVNLVSCSSMLKDDNISPLIHCESSLSKAQKDDTDSKIMPGQEESRFQDQTLLTECSSTSSDVAREGPERFSFDKSKLRFSDEPIVFSHRGTDQFWLEENDLNLYLLEDCADPWDGTFRKSHGCTETLKKLLMLRSCISLESIRQLGEAKWKGPSARGVGDDPQAPSMAYSALRDH